MASPLGVGPAVDRPRPVQLRPLGIGEILDAAFKLFRARFRAMVVATVLVTLPAIILLAVVQASTGDPNDLSRTDEVTGLETIDGGAFATFLGGTLVSTFVLVLAANLALAGTIRLSISVYLGEEAGWRDSIRFAFARRGRLTVLLLVTTLGQLLGALLCLVPYVWLAGIWAVAVPALLVEELRPVRSLGRSKELVDGRFWSVLGTVLLAGLLTSLIQGVLSAPVIILQLVGANVVVTAILSAIVQLIGLSITLPFAGTVTAVLYFDLRVRKEGYDLELMARRVGVDPPPDEPSRPPPGPTAPAGGWGAPAPPGGSWPGPPGG